VTWDQAACPQGEPLSWLGYDGKAGEHWFGVGAEPELCRCCWEAARCPRQFAYPPAQHETLLGLLPLASRLAQQVLQQVRPWIEPAQSFEKNQLGLGDVFFNSLRFTWTMALLADAAVLLRARALLGRPPLRPLLANLMPFQLSLELDERETPRLCRGGSQSLTIPGVLRGRRWAHWAGISSGEQRLAPGKGASPGVKPVPLRPPIVLLRPAPKSRRTQRERMLNERSDGPSGFEPLHLRQASGFAGGR
jgi:hypothetical protein